MSGVVRVAGVGDLHCSRTSPGTLHTLFAKATESAELLLLAGDLTDNGLPDEARLLARELAAVHVPVIAVLGNHDFESGRNDDVRQILAEAGVTMLDGDACETHGIGIAGVKGFGGGFGPRALAPWGEPTIKAFVHDAVSEALKLEVALAKMKSMPLVALLHYAPVQQTVEGEPPEIFPFLGSSRLEEPINNYRVSLVLHSHAHCGRPEGATKTGVPVYNVSMPLLARAFSDRPPFRLFEIPVADAPLEQGAAAPGQKPAVSSLVHDVVLAAGGATPGERRSADRRS
jgi:Icc-related predicted phosphoesterase